MEGGRSGQQEAICSQLSGPVILVLGTKAGACTLLFVLTLLYLSFPRKVPSALSVENPAFSGLLWESPLRHAQRYVSWIIANLLKLRSNPVRTAPPVTTPD